MAETQAPEILLARRLIAGDELALDAFIRFFQKSVFRYSLMMCGQRDDAEEVAQETLMKVFERFHQLNQPEHVKAWVFTIARNACLTHRRRSVYAPDHELSLDEFLPEWKHEGGQRKLQIADWSHLPDEQLLNKELRGQLQSAIGALPENYRSVLLLRDMEGMSTAETAAILELTDEAVKTRLHRARLAVRKQLDEYLRTERVRYDGSAM